MAIREGPLENMVLTQSFWQGKKVFLTGHTGFKGSWMSLLLHALGADVTGFSLPRNVTPGLFKYLDLPGMHHYEGNLCHPKILAHALDACQPDIIIHLAAQSLVRTGYAEPIQTFASNIMGTAHLLECLRPHSQRCAVLIVTSDKVYWNTETGHPFQEDSPLGGRDPYSASKACTEWVTVAYQQSFFPSEDFEEHQKSIARVRAGNVIGGGDWSQDRLLPDLIQAYLKGQPAALRNPLAIRPWQHVLEPLTGYLMLCEKLYSTGQECSGAWNFGPADSDDERSVAWVAEYLADRFTVQPAWVQMQGTHPYEAQSLRLNSNKALTKLKWKPKLKLEHALNWIADWYLDWQTGKNVQQITQAQIKKYLEIAG